MGKGGFRDLIVWQRAKALAVMVYGVTDTSVLKRDFSLRDQIRRSAVSIASNLAEGDERDTDRDSVRFFYMAKGSLAELRTQIQIACEVGHMEQGTYTEIESKCEELGRMIGRLIGARREK